MLFPTPEEVTVVLVAEAEAAEAQQVVWGHLVALAATAAF
jgi:hypothetical protein